MAMKPQKKGRGSTVEKRNHDSNLASTGNSSKQSLVSRGQATVERHFRSFFAVLRSWITPQEENSGSASGSNQNDSASHSLKKAFIDRLRIALPMVADAALLVFWVMLVWVVDNCVLQPFADRTGLNGRILKSLEFILGVPIIIQAIVVTLYDLFTVLSVVVIDISRLVHRTIYTVKKQWQIK